MEETLSLFQLNEYIRRVIALNFEFPVWVSAEVSQVKQSRGHYYLDLVEKDDETDKILAQSGAVIWANTFWFLKKKLGDFIYELLKDGVELRFKVNVDFHERYGLKLVVEDIDASYTLGKLELARRQILESLREQQLLDRNAQIPLPRVIQRIAVMSSERAAGFQDFLKQLEENVYGYSFSYTLFEVALQGEKVESDVVRALRQIADSRNEFDCAVLIRGGGAKIDLASFDNFAIGQTIAQMPIPVITGIGHEIDQTVADLVAHTFCKTPTAVAEFFISHNARFESSLENMAFMLRRAGRDNLHRAQAFLGQAEAWVRQLPVQQFRTQARNLGHIETTCFHAIRTRILREAGKADAVERVMASLHPSNALQRGFSITTDDEGNLITTIASLASGDKIHTRLANGTIESTINELNANDE